MVASMGRLRGAPEAAWINVLVAFGGIALIFALQALRSDPPNLTAPMNNGLIFAAVAAVSAALILLSMRDLGPHLAIAGLFGIIYLIGAGFLAPRIGIALFASSVTAGTLLGSVALDHVGAFGTEVHKLGVLRVAGAACLLLGVLLVRSDS
jgi:hypothetical protein